MDVLGCNLLGFSLLKRWLANGPCPTRQNKKALPAAEALNSAIDDLELALACGFSFLLGPLTLWLCCMCIEDFWGKEAKQRKRVSFLTKATSPGVGRWMLSALSASVPYGR
eukprot:TRINITY_DN6015_c0_g1_i1.p1 TRINITY_DN6015_c0_g1~~TRINITY_DN6015_c0_g1_i1.p1  ORF type:complete len:119 (+),score=8.96 TRINITY_DN6015_c0_g1_i1:26-358(+)